MRDTRGRARGMKSWPAGTTIPSSPVNTTLLHPIDTNMFSRLSTIFFSVVALAGVATAVPADLEARQISQCDTGGVQCCTSYYSVRISRRRQ